MTVVLMFEVHASDWDDLDHTLGLAWQNKFAKYCNI